MRKIIHGQAKPIYFRYHVARLAGALGGFLFALLVAAGSFRAVVNISC